MGMFKLRDYQQAASDKAVAFFMDRKKQNNAIMVLPTGSGKSLIIADIASKYIRDGKEIDRCLLFYTLHGIVEETMYSINQNRLKNNYVDIAIILKMNIDKLQSRLERNVIKGDEDDR